MSSDTLQRGFLLLMAAGIVPVALSYGLAPGATLPWLIGIDATDVDVRHVFRAIMGLYLGMVTFWIAGALRADLRVPALWTVFVFTAGIALGRALSLVTDGWPHPLLVVYLVAEVGLAAAALTLIRTAPARSV